LIQILNTAKQPPRGRTLRPLPVPAGLKRAPGSHT